MKKNKSGFILLPLVFIVLIISVVGYFLINKKSTINGIGQTLATPTSIPNSENIDGWKSYTNSAYNYSIQHPSDWKIEINCFGGSAESKIVCLESPNLETDAFPKVVKGGVIQIFGKSDGDGSVGLGYSLDQFCNSQGGTDEKPSYCNETNINGNPVVERGFVNLPFIDIGFLDKNKKIFLSIRMEAKNDTKDVAYQIVKSFKFTNLTDWKTFKKDNFTLKYPSYFPDIIEKQKQYGEQTISTSYVSTYFDSNKKSGGPEYTVALTLIDYGPSVENLESWVANNQFPMEADYGEGVIDTIRRRERSDVIVLQEVPKDPFTVSLRNEIYFQKGGSRYALIYRISSNPTEATKYSKDFEDILLNYFELGN